MLAIDLTRLYIEITKEFPSFKVVPKAKSLQMKLINVFLCLISFGQQRKYMTDYTTTIGTTIYLPSNWEILPYTKRAEILRHERVHMRQAQKYGRWLFSFLYLFAYLPIGFAHWRTKFEMEAYEESLQAMYEYGEDLWDTRHRMWLIDVFTGPGYLWMHPFTHDINLWFDTTVLRITGSSAKPVDS